MQTQGDRGTRGLGLWPGVIVDQHFVRRERLHRLLAAVLDRPQLVGVGIDESTAAVVTGSRFEVIGSGAGDRHRRPQGQGAAGREGRIRRRHRPDAARPEAGDVIRPGTGRRAMTALTRAQVRELDRRATEEYGVPGVVLMENAGRGAAELLMRLNPERRPVVVCCGKGNNGGDGFVIARHLDIYNYPIIVVLFADPNELTGDAAVNYGIVSKAGIRVLPALQGPEVLDQHTLVCFSEADVDGLSMPSLEPDSAAPVREPFDWSDYDAEPCWEMTA